MNRTRLVLVLFFTACSEPEPAFDADPEAQAAQPLAARSGSDRVVLWQQNIEAMKAATVKPYRLTRAMHALPLAPDIVVLAEAWQKVLCGDYLNPQSHGNPDLSAWRGSPRDARGLAMGCRHGADALPGSLLYRLGASLWGVGHVAHRRPFSDELGSTSRTGTAVAWDSSRFTLEDDFVYDDADVPGCSKALDDYQRVAVLLRDTRRTPSRADDRLLAIASVHYGSACRGDSNRWVADQMTRRWGARGLDLRVIAGDFNARVDESSDLYAQRRREQHEEGWYRSLTEQLGFLDAARVRHAGNICAQWTYPNVQHCVGAASCDARCEGFGIGGQLDRLDFTFLSGVRASQVLANQTDEGSAACSDHKGSYTVVGW
ncbi:MAG: endonuclease/exonuclease/phosphatase family protein [Archangiaceae bacterium]|nr:endonuclease/exonuclease/phosphatase family protein [Archangiaceae bacterium]